MLLLVAKMSKSAIMIVSIVFFVFAILYQATGMVISFYVGEENMVDFQKWFGKLSILSVSSFVSLVLGVIGSMVSLFMPSSYHYVITPDMWTNDQVNNRSGYDWYVRIPAKQHKMGKRATVSSTFYKEGDKAFIFSLFPSAPMSNGDIYVGGPAKAGEVKVVIIP